MNSFLSVATFFTQASDFITAKWPELLAILGGSGGILLILKFVLSLILTKVRNSSIKKYSTEIEGKFKVVEEQMKTLEGNIKTQNQEFLDKFKEEYQELNDEYASIKLKVYDDIMTKEEKTEINEILDNAIVDVETKEEPFVEVKEEPKEMPVEENIVIMEKVISNG